MGIMDKAKKFEDAQASATQQQRDTEATSAHEALEALLVRVVGVANRYDALGDEAFDTKDVERIKDLHREVTQILSNALTQHGLRSTSSVPASPPPAPTQQPATPPVSSTPKADDTVEQPAVPTSPSSAHTEPDKEAKDANSATTAGTPTSTSPGARDVLGSFMDRVLGPKVDNPKKPR